MKDLKTMKSVILEQKDLRNIYLAFVKPVPIECYAIKIDGQTFVTSRGKMLWKKENHAIKALRMSIEPVVRRHIRSKLRSQGISEYYNHPEYYNAWDNFRKYLEDNNILQIIKFEQ